MRVGSRGGFLLDYPCLLLQGQRNSTLCMIFGVLADLLKMYGYPPSLPVWAGC